MAARKKVGLSLVVGANVRRLRLKAGMSQNELAEAAGVEQGSISAIEVGLRGPSMLMVMAIAKALDVPPTSLFREVKPSP
jgi:transcriptional regulator with XRE-family HTH domain